MYANLRRHNPDGRYEVIIHEWLSGVRHLSATHALAAGMAIKDLNVAFASKHLRMLAPSRLATLDEVLTFGLGSALNLAEYKLFLRDLQDLKGRLSELGAE